MLIFFSTLFNFFFFFFFHVDQCCLPNTEVMHVSIQIWVIQCCLTNTNLKVMHVSIKIWVIQCCLPNTQVMHVSIKLWMVEILLNCFRCSSFLSDSLVTNAIKLLCFTKFPKGIRGPLVFWLVIYQNNAFWQTTNSIQNNIANWIEL